MKFVADFHLHSKYSRATSPSMDLENLDKWAKIKGIKVTEAGDGLDGLTKLTNTKFDLIIADINMPVMDGLKLVDMARKNEE